MITTGDVKISLLLRSLSQCYPAELDAVQCPLDGHKTLYSSNDRRRLLINSRGTERSARRCRYFCIGYWGLILALPWGLRR